MQHLHRKHAHQAPGQAEFQADVTAQIEFLFGIIPPCGVKQRFQRPAGDQLQRAGQQGAAHEQRQRPIRQRLQRHEHDHHAEAVDGADRPVQKAPVHPFAGAQGAEHHLQAPAQKGVDQKIPQNRVQGIFHSDTTSRKTASRGCVWFYGILWRCFNIIASRRPCVI